MSFWRFKLLEFAVWGATGALLIPVVFGFGILIAQVFQPVSDFIAMILLGAVWLISSIFLSNVLTAKLAKRWSR
ncbi:MULTISPECIES: hypothetical protein [Citromicrobium]|uniref:hypothetical protein n=1 Tax=Citromicrobium TaxID=72173 RepID=UPI0001DD0A6E|nr:MULTISPECIES: hypothetical protein [Citromicrobium]